MPRAPDASANFAQPWSFYVLKLSQPLHFGDDGGLPLQIIWALLDIASIIVLAWLMLGLVTAVCLRFAPGMPPPENDAALPVGSNSFDLGPGSKACRWFGGLRSNEFDPTGLPALFG